MSGFLVTLDNIIIVLDSAIIDRSSKKPSSAFIESVATLEKKYSESAGEVEIDRLKMVLNSFFQNIEEKPEHHPELPFSY